VWGGGIYNALVEATVIASTFSGNSAAFGGGGLFNTSSGTTNVTASTFSNNSSGFLGGAVANLGPGTVNLNSSTFNGNSTGFVGGAIYNASFDGSSFMTIIACTISGNSAGSEGGGIYNFDFDTVTISNTIVAVNTAPAAPDVRGFFNSLGHNLIGIGDGSTGFGAEGDLVGTAEDPIDPLLGALQDNGGPTWTMELLFGSPALDAGDPDLDGTTDQRGVLRPQGDGVDIGAFELLNNPPTLTSVARLSGAIEDTDFTIMFYGGRLLSHLSFGADLSGELIPLLRLNRNAVVILDSERTAKGQHLKKSRKELVARIESELKSISNHLVWVTQGRDIENYIAKDALEKFGQAKWNGEFNLNYDPFQTLDEMFKWGKTRRKKFNYSNAKVEYCREIVLHLSNEHLDVLDLKNKLARIATIIEGWCPKRVPINAA
jgi:hypothetical protein